MKILISFFTVWKRQRAMTTEWRITQKERRGDTGERKKGDKGIQNRKNSGEGNVLTRKRGMKEGVQEEQWNRKK
jgi:hypothetical protein